MKRRKTKSYPFSSKEREPRNEKMHLVAQLSLSLPLTDPHSLYLYLSPSLTFLLFLSLSLPPWLSYSFSISIYLSLTDSLFHSFFLSFPPSLFLFLSISFSFFLSLLFILSPFLSHFLFFLSLFSHFFLPLSLHFSFLVSLPSSLPPSLSISYILVSIILSLSYTPLLPSIGYNNNGHHWKASATLEEGIFKRWANIRDEEEKLKHHWKSGSNKKTIKNLDFIIDNKRLYKLHCLVDWHAFKNLIYDRTMLKKLLSDVITIRLLQRS